MKPSRPFDFAQGGETCRTTRRPERKRRVSYLVSNGMPVWREMSSSSSTTGLSSGMPSLLRIASASRSGSPGMSGPLVPDAGLVFRKKALGLLLAFNGCYTTLFRRPLIPQFASSPAARGF